MMDDADAKEVETFTDHWGLDPESRDFLLGLPLKVREAIMDGFAPPPNTRNIDGKLRAFARKTAEQLGHHEVGPPSHRGAPGPLRAPVNGRAAHRVADPVEKFVDSWGLDEFSLQLLRQQPRELLDDVMANFAPPTDTRNVNARLAAYIKRRISETSQDSYQQPEPLSLPVRAYTPRGPRKSLDFQLRDFADRWGIDEDAFHMLQQLQHNVLETVLNSFDPPANTNNVNAKLNAFVRTTKEKVAAGKDVLQSEPEPETRPWTREAALPAYPNDYGRSARSEYRPPRPDPRSRRRPSLEDDIDAFISTWGCDEQSQGLLRSLRPVHASMVMQQFDPPEGTVNVSGRLCAYIRSVLERDPNPSGGAPPVDLAEEFAGYWGINDSALQSLRSLPGDLQDSIMADFHPPPGTLNVSGKLFAFISKRAAEFRGSGGGPATRPPEDRRRPRGQGGLPRAAGGGPRRGRDMLRFMEDWKLDGEASRLMEAMPEDMRQDVMRCFQPPPGTWNFSGRFVAFVRARLKEQGYDVTGGDLMAVIAEVSSSGQQADADDVADVDDLTDFIQRWGVDRTNEARIRELPQELQDHVFAEFAPPRETRNINAKLATWMRKLTASSTGDPEAKRARHE